MTTSAPPPPARARRPASLRDNRGIASVALFIFAMVSIMILVANFQLNYAVSSTSDAYDTFSSQTVEKNGIAQMVKESILAIRETAIANSTNSLQTEIQNRLSSMAFPAAVTVAIDPDSPMPTVPANPFFPVGVPAAASQPEYFNPSASTRAVAGMGNLFTSLCVLGPAADLGRLTVTFDRSNLNSDGSADPNDNRTYVVNADLFSVPLTNVDVVAYGLPVTGIIPVASPAVPPGFFGPGVSCLVATSDNPAIDPTAFPDLFASSTIEQLPYQFRNAISFSWNAYEYLWSPGYQDALLSTAAANGAIYNIAIPPDPFNPIPGCSGAGNSVTVNLSLVTGPILAIIDPNGGSNINLDGSGASGQPLVVLVQNSSGNRTKVNFSGNNNRPTIFYLEDANAVFSGSPQYQGALFLDPNCTASGAVVWFGHFSFYGPASPLSTLAITMEDSPAVKTALAALAPRVLLVSTTATR